MAEPTWEELTTDENEPDWDALYEERNVDNMFHSGPNTGEERRGFYTKAYAEAVKEGLPDVYYAWSWTPDEDEY